MTLPLDSSTKEVLIRSISCETWAPLDFHLFATLTGQAGRRASVFVRSILRVPDDGDSRTVTYGRTDIYEASAYQCRVARCYYRHTDHKNGMYWWRRFDVDATDDQIVSSAASDLIECAHLHVPPTPSAVATDDPQLTLTLPARSTSTDRAELSDAELRCEIDRARQQLRDLEAIAADRIADHERTIALLRGAA
jgi:hypothetical protein